MKPQQGWQRPYGVRQLTLQDYLLIRKLDIWLGPAHVMRVHPGYMSYSLNSVRGAI